MSDVLDGVYDKCVDKVTIIDCRYPFEYEGGHIEVNINLASILGANQDLYLK